MTARRVLLIDDDDDIRGVAELALTSLAGWEVLTASGGAEGVDMAGVALPDAVLLDVMMPGMDGPTTVARLQEDDRTRGIPVVLLTAKAHGAHRDRLGGLGVAGVLTKPFDPMTLHDQIASLLGWEA